MQVVAVIHRDPGTDYGISFPDFPGCISAGSTLDEVLELGTEALNAHIALMLEDGDIFPVVRELEELRSDPEFAVDFEGAIVATVPAFVPGRPTQRVDVTIDGDLLQEIDAAAKTFPGGRNGFLAQAAKEKILGAR
jgi:predicted RNase H-like HicB family nuclease